MGNVAFLRQASLAAHAKKIMAILSIVVGLPRFTDTIGIIPVVAPTWVSIYMWFFFDNLQKLRVGNIINAARWFAFNVGTGLYIASIGRIIVVLVNSFAFVKNKQD